MHRARISPNRQCAKFMCSFIYQPTLASQTRKVTAIRIALYCRLRLARRPICALRAAPAASRSAPLRCHPCLRTRRRGRVPEPRRLSATERARRQLAFAVGLLFATRWRLDGGAKTDRASAISERHPRLVGPNRDVSINSVRISFALRRRVSPSPRGRDVLSPVFGQPRRVALFWYRSLSNLVSI